MIAALGQSEVYGVPLRFRSVFPRLFKAFHRAKRAQRSLRSTTAPIAAVSGASLPSLTTTTTPPIVAVSSFLNHHHHFWRASPFLVLVRRFAVIYAKAKGAFLSSQPPPPSPLLALVAISGAWSSDFGYRRPTTQEPTLFRLNHHHHHHHHHHFWRSSPFLVFQTTKHGPPQRSSTPSNASRHREVAIEHSRYKGDGRGGLYLTGRIKRKVVQRVRAGQLPKSAIDEEMEVKVGHTRTLPRRRKQYKKCVHSTYCTIWSAYYPARLRMKAERLVHLALRAKGAHPILYACPGVKCRKRHREFYPLKAAGGWSAVEDEVVSALKATGQKGIERIELENELVCNALLLQRLYRVKCGHYDSILQNANAPFLSDFKLFKIRQYSERGHYDSILQNANAPFLSDFKLFKIRQYSERGNYDSILQNANAPFLSDFKLFKIRQCSSASKLRSPRQNLPILKRPRKTLISTSSSPRCSVTAKNPLNRRGSTAQPAGAPQGTPQGTPWGYAESCSFSGAFQNS
ncbi:hypothetical protein C8R44DRAFT_731325 [Mycena epipterygia]|nr:hypothetical protein C8R44DRAFT_731325 [Mycena epipterygia]